MMLTAGNALAEEIHIAVASNFTDTLKKISSRFEANTGNKVTLVFGSTGRHYAQIKNGAPFELFFAADTRRPRLLDEEGIALPSSRFTYAIGKVVLWSPQPGLVDKAGQILDSDKFRYLAVANPKLAPYGRAAQQVLEGRELWTILRSRMVRGENIGQTFQFVKSGNAELGFIALSQIKRPNKAIEGSLWVVPESLYEPIEQQAVLLKENDVARNFLDFIKSNEALEIIHGFGYGTP
ncbi:MAG: molybdate ABC transporter substrate-binding protein [Gammaproteobacteria bacterium]|nr:molybdate ABC transporter substrate-binding protein [Gammaproteobacteria bacterium]